MSDNVTYKEIFPAVKITTRLTRLSLDKKSRSGRSHQIKLSLSLGKKKSCNSSENFAASRTLAS